MRDGSYGGRVLFGTIVSEYYFEGWLLKKLTPAR